MEYEAQVDQPENKLQWPVVLCYSEADADKAEDFRKMLEKNARPCKTESDGKPFPCWNEMDCSIEAMDCGCALVLVTKQAECCDQVEMMINQALADGCALVFVYLEECVFTALPVDNADQILVCGPYEDEINRLLRYLEFLCDDKVELAYVEESFGSEEVKKRVSSAGNENYAAWGMYAGSSEVLIIMGLAITMLLLLLCFEDEIRAIIVDLLQKIGWDFLIPFYSGV